MSQKQIKDTNDIDNELQTKAYGIGQRAFLVLK